jgi:hypothetical protein
MKPVSRPQFTGKMPIFGSWKYCALSFKVPMANKTVKYGFLFSVAVLGKAMPGINFRQLRADVSMAEVLRLLGFDIHTRSGDQVRGPCPLHERSEHGKHRSFSANLACNTFQCFKCGASGNHLDLWAKATKKSIYEAALDLCTRLNKEPPWLTSPTEKRNP